MRQAPFYSSDRFPGDFVVSLLVAAGACLVSGPVVWYFALAYLRRTYPGHVELNGAAALAGLLDGVLVGVGAFVATFAVRVYLYERRDRKQSDHLLKVTLDEMARKRNGR